MVEDMCEQGWVHHDEVITALRTVPRHLFVPDASLEAAYRADDVVITKRDDNGMAISSVSAPRVQAMMLEQAQLRPGMRVLEIGSGGYNAALIAELIGPHGQVTTVDIDADVVDHARHYLGLAGYPQVDVVLADAEHGVPEHAPYDRIIVTVGAWDIPPAWLDQLAPDGSLVVPMRMRGLTRSVRFTRENGYLVDQGYELCGFVAMQGHGANREQLVLLHGEDVGLRVDGPHAHDTGLLSAALATPPVQRWSGVLVGGFEPFDELDLWLATVIDDFALLAAKKDAIDAGMVAKSTLMGAKAIIAGDTFAYRGSSRPVDEERAQFEFGVIAHGPDADHLAEHYTDLIRTWDRTHRHGPAARITVHPAGTPDTNLPEGRVIDKTHTRVVISWPHTIAPGSAAKSANAPHEQEDQSP
ncbi:MAG: methyltransferase, FxLD system [Actinomycetota bacterium]|nr:methyltransferase, FxLD system [Actinomycetota bacterium]